MSELPRVAIIGAGLAGLTCARELVQDGVEPVFFEIGRGLGGRLSTRRAEGGYQFDHGARYLTAEGDDFAFALRKAELAGAVARWSLDWEETAFVGVPGMTGLAKSMADGLNIRKGVRITQIHQTDKGWELVWDGGAEVFDRVVATAPAPQTAALLTDGHPFRDAFDAVGMEPCLTLMIALPSDQGVPFVARRDPSDDLSWIALDSAKPERPNLPCLVAQASPDWSMRHLELEMHEIATQMLPLVSQVLGAQLIGDLPYVAAHRWRYGLVSKPLSQLFLADKTQSLFVGGDWCLGARAEHAWTSGAAIANTLLKTI
mgnify:CR=1 FL=1